MSYVSVDFEDVETGVRFWDLCSRSEMPELGVEVELEVDGEMRRVRRIMSVPQQADVAYYEQITGWSQPTLKQAKAKGQTLAKHYDKHGRPVFTSRREINEYQAKANDNPNQGATLHWAK